MRNERSLPALAWDGERPQDQGITSMAACISIITCIIGAGIVALPQLPKTGGTVVSTIMMVVSACITIEAGCALWRALMANNAAFARGSKAASTYIHSYEDFGLAAYGRPGALLIQAITTFWFTGLGAGYIILIGENVQSVFLPLVDLDYRLWVIIMSPVLWLLSMMRDVSAIARMIPIGVVAAISSCVLIIAEAGMDIQLWEDWPPQEVTQLHNVWPAGNFMSLGSLTATAFGAFGCVGILPAIIDEMKSQDRFKRSFRTALSIVMLLYICIMLVGYHAYGNLIQPNILNSMKYHPATYEESRLPPDQWAGRHSTAVPTAMSCCMLVNLVISYPLILVPVFIAIQRTAYGKENLQLGSKNNILMRTTIVLLTVAVPLVFEDFDLVFALFASICMPVQGVLIPIIFGSKIRNNVGAEDTRLPRKILHATMSALAIFCLVIGFTDSVSAMVDSFGR